MEANPGADRDPEPPEAYPARAEKANAVRSSNSTPAIGVSLPSRNFQPLVLDGYAPFAALQDLRAWNCPAIQVKNFLAPGQAATIAKNFDSLIATVGSARADGGSAYEIGATAYAKDTEAYLKASEDATAKLAQLFRGAVNLPEYLRAAIQATEPAGRVIRPIEFDGRLGSLMRAVSWRDTGTYALRLHTDEEQFLTPAIRELPVFGCSTPIAANVYTRACGSKLRLYNCMMTRATKARLGLTDPKSLGYPIDEQYMEGHFERLDLNLEDGDLVLANGALVHGVPNSPGIQGRQLFNSFFLVQADDPTQVFMGA